jgi:flagellar hook assembly protein FlgD
MPETPDTTRRLTRRTVALCSDSLTGDRVATLAHGKRKAGSHSSRWDGRDDDGRKLASGVYMYRLEAGGWAETRKLLLLH